MKMVRKKANVARNEVILSQDEAPNGQDEIASRMKELRIKQPALGSKRKWTRTILARRTSAIG